MGPVDFLTSQARVLLAGILALFTHRGLTINEDLKV
ncbi:hypothetical protein SLEP1_g6678 [Rubroshorea leprosula]|uniref:Uncharacterized protein n=1 Tax=Rubroshorea leprosula TaxID=152421 RepID=A0AAV5I6X5_9ROSI|nr:hypothetical protein SLEP1_g6678 [Rubroshorea leprosula]